jgi:hypothetical protein
MTSKTVQFDASGQPKKMPGWFSWRHTNDAHLEAVELYRTRADRRPKQHWDEATETWIKQVSS